MDGDSLEDFASRTASAWGICEQGKNNAAILFAVRNERRAHIVVGQGLEGKLTDNKSDLIIKNVIFPELKKGEFNIGFSNGIAAFVKTIRGEFTAKDIKQPPKKGLYFRNYEAIPFALVLIMGVVQPLGLVSRKLSSAAGAILALAAGYFWGCEFVGDLNSYTFWHDNRSNRLV